MTYRFEREDNPHKNGPLRFYRVIDQARGLRLELQRRDQNTDHFWFWQNARCFSLFVDQLPSEPGTTDINLAITTLGLHDRISGQYLDRDEAQVAMPLVHEAIEAFWRGLSPAKALAKITITDSWAGDEGIHRSGTPNSIVTSR